MALKLEDIKAPIASEMKEFEFKFRDSMKTHILLLDKIMNYIVKRKGKQMRPDFGHLGASADHHQWRAEREDRAAYAE